MDNEPTLDIAKESREKLSQELDLYEQQIGLDKWTNVDAPTYLTLSLEDLKRKTPEELSEAGYLLAQYSFNIQRAINRNRAWERWAKNKLDSVATENFDKIGNNGWQERMIVAKNSGEAAQKLQDFLLRIGMRLDRLWGTNESIRLIMDCIKDIKFTMIREQGTNG